MKFLALVLFAFVGIVASKEVIPDTQSILDEASDDLIKAFSEGLNEIPAPEGAEDEAQKVTLLV